MKNTDSWRKAHTALGLAAAGLFLAALAIAGTPGIPGDTTADAVTGQRSLTLRGINFINAVSLSSPAGLAIDGSITPHRLFVADPNNNRVLAFPDADSFVNGEPATVVLGQGDFFSSFPNRQPFSGKGPIAFSSSPSRAALGAPNLLPSPNSLWSPLGVTVDASGDVWVADSNNNRVLLYPAPITTGENATVVLGQPNRYVNACKPVSARTLCDPVSVALDVFGDVFVSDSASNRILMYSPNPSQGAPAVLVIGQPDFVSQNCNAPTAQSLCNPGGIAFDSNGALWVADSNNNRVLRFSQIVNQASADVVIGQSNFTSGGCGTGARNCAIRPMSGLIPAEISTSRITTIAVSLSTILTRHPLRLGE